MSTSTEPTITLTDGREWWIPGDTYSGVTSQGRISHEAPENLEEAVAGYHGEGEPPTEEDLGSSGETPRTTSPRWPR